MLEAVKQNWRVYEYLPGELRANKKIAAAALELHPHLLIGDSVPSSLLQNEPEFAIAFVREDAANLEYILRKPNLNLDGEFAGDLLEVAKGAPHFQSCLKKPQHYSHICDLYKETITLNHRKARKAHRVIFG